MRWDENAVLEIAPNMRQLRLRQKGQAYQKEAAISVEIGI